MERILTMVKEIIEKLEMIKDAARGMIYLLNGLWKRIVDNFELTHRGRSLVAILIVVVIILLKWKATGIIENNSLSNHIEQANIQLEEKKDNIEALKSENKRLRDQHRALGDYTQNEISSATQNIEDFMRDWDYLDFYIQNGNEFCPRPKGGNNYQRIVFKRETPLTGSEMDIKFDIVNEESNLIYTQRFVVGIQNEEGPLAEYDIPTRGGQNVNFRERRNVLGESGEYHDVFDEFVNGESLPSPAKEGGIINLTFKSFAFNSDKIGTNLNLGYFSALEKYGSQTGEFSQVYSTEDTEPESSSVNLYIGSYVGGCIKILNWKVK